MEEEIQYRLHHDKEKWICYWEENCLVSLCIALFLILVRDEGAQAHLKLYTRGLCENDTVISLKDVFHVIKRWIHMTDTCYAQDLYMPDLSF